MYKAVHGLAPIYIWQLLTDYQLIRCLRSTSKDLLEEPMANLAAVGDLTCVSFLPLEFAGPCDQAC